ncbi:hypothetical protein L9F63_021647, partial [Diploptera punctata]
GSCYLLSWFRLYLSFICSSQDIRIRGGGLDSGYQDDESTRKCDNFTTISDGMENIVVNDCRKQFEVGNLGSQSYIYTTAVKLIGKYSIAIIKSLQSCVTFQLPSMNSDELIYVWLLLPYWSWESSNESIRIYGGGKCQKLHPKTFLRNSQHQPVPPEDNPIDWVMIRESWKNVPHSKKLLLLYSRDSPAFMKFQSLSPLSRFIGPPIEVLDIFEWEETEDASRNITGWLTRYIVNSDVKIVIIVSEGAMIRQKALLDNIKLELKKPHFLDPVFTQALQLLHDPNLGNDYSRIFPVRFDDFTCNTAKLSLIVPLRCYVLLRDLGKLIFELRNSSAPGEPDLEDIRSHCSDEVDMLETAITNTKVFYRENAHYFSN